MKPLPVGLDIGTGRAVVMLPGFAMTPGLYRPTAELLAQRCRVVVVDIYRIRGPWRHDEIVDRLEATIKDRRCMRISLIGHSFAVGVELAFATRFPEHVRELVFADTLAASRRIGLADEAMRHPVRFLWMATPAAAWSFGSTSVTHPRQVVEAAWYGFRSGRARDCERVVELGIPAHVLWANRDSILTQADGRAFADELHASFNVVKSPDGKPVDHDWIYRHPQLFFDHVDQLDLLARR